VPFAGFWSKDEILGDAWNHGHWVVWGVLTLASFLTAFYMTRQWRTVFFGAYRGDNPLRWQPTERPDTILGEAYEEDEPHPSDVPAHAHDEYQHGAEAHTEHSHDHPTAGHEQPRESPWTIVMPLVILATFAVAAGFFNLPFSIPGAHWLSDLLGQEAAIFNWLVALLALLVGLAGIAAGWFLYDKAFARAQDQDPFEAKSPGLFTWLNHAFSIDYIYARTIVWFAGRLAQAWRWFDRTVLSRIVAGVAYLTGLLGRLNFIVDDTVLNDGPDALASGTRATGDGMRRSQTGRAQDYIALVFAGIVVLALLYLYGI
jgi:NADH-quinone oxidoreductase subunit L